MPYSELLLWVYCLWCISVGLAVGCVLFSVNSVGHGVSLLLVGLLLFCVRVAAFCGFVSRFG